MFLSLFNGTPDDLNEYLDKCLTLWDKIHPDLPKLIKSSPPPPKSRAQDVCVSVESCTKAQFILKRSVIDIKCIGSILMRYGDLKPAHKQPQLDY